MLKARYTMYIVEDCGGAASPAAQDADLSRMVQAAKIGLTTIATISGIGGTAALRRIDDGPAAPVLV